MAKKDFTEAAEGAPKKPPRVGMAHKFLIGYNAGDPISGDEDLYM